MKTILIDARGLNYLKQTGINIYTLHVFKVLQDLNNEHALSKRNHADLKSNGLKKPSAPFRMILMGIKPHELKILRFRYPWLSKELSSTISLQEYLTIPSFLRSIMTNKVLGVFLELLLFILPRWLFDRLLVRQKTADIIWQPLHKALPIHPSTDHYITTIHDLFGVKHHYGLLPGEFVRENKTTLRKTANRSNKIIAVSYSTASDVIETLQQNEQKVQVIYSGLLDSSLLYSPTNITTNSVSTQKSYLVKPPSSPYFVCISGIEPRKNWFNIIAAHYYNTLHHPDYSTASLYLIGIPINRRYYRQLVDFIAEQKIPNVHFVLNADEQTKKVYLRNSVCLIYASLYEGFGFPLLEAMSESKAVITSQVSSMPEIAKTAALYVNPLDIADIARSMRLMLNDADLRVKMENGTAEILKEFSWDENSIFWKKILN